MNPNHRLLSFAHSSRSALLVTILAGAFGGILTIAQARILSLTINGVYLQGQSIQDVWGFLRTLLWIIAARSLLIWISEASSKAIALRVKNDVRMSLFSRIVDLGPSFARRERTGELSTVMVEGIEALDAYFSQYLPQLIVSTLVPLSILVFVFPIDPLSGLALLLTAPLIPVFMILIGKAAEALTNRQYETLSRLSAHFLDSLQGLTTLKIFGQSKNHSQSIKDVSDKYRVATMNVLRVTFLSALVLELVASLSTAVVAVEVGLRLLHFNLGFSEALFLLILAPDFYIPLRMLGLRFHAGMQGTSAARRIFRILDIVPHVEEDVVNVETITKDWSAIEFSEVSFTYPEGGTSALKKISLTIERGQKIALVGASGAGKSTLTQLLLRFIRPSEGAIFCDGIPLANISKACWQDQISWVPQNPYIFNETILENIRLGRLDTGMGAVIKAAKAAHLHEFVASLPKGYETIVGEGGARLSSGQIQQLALARAFLRDAPILILDEPTSSLDPATEATLVNSTRKLMEGRTVITIAHRLNTVAHADLILVLKDGQLVEFGSHGDLLARKSAYFDLVGSKLDGIDSVVAPTKPEVREVISAQASLYDADNLGSPQSANMLMRLLGFFKGAWPDVGLAVLVGSATIASSIGLIGTSSWLISAAALHPSIAELQVAIVGVRFFGISRGVFRYLERLISHRVTFRLLARLRTWLFRSIEPLAPARLLEFRSGDLLSRLVGDVETLENFFVRIVSPSAIALVISLGTAALLGTFSPFLAWSLLIFLFLVGIGLPLITGVLSDRPGRKMVSQRASLHTQLVDNIQGFPDLTAFGRIGDRIEQAMAMGKDYGATQQQMAWISGFNSGLGSFFSNLAMWTSLVVGINGVVSGHLPGLMLAALILITLVSFEAVTPLPLAAQVLGETTKAAQRLFQIVDTKPEIQERAQKYPSIDTLKSLRFSDFSFNYPGALSPTIRHVSFQLSIGKKIAIVGPSGAGKSTLMNLLLRFWEYHDGDILLNGQPLKGFSPDDVRALFSVVPQRPFFFNTTVRENLMIGRPDASQAEIERAAKQAQIDRFIRSLPKGYNTYIGEKGFRLSGGERQRLAIARAILVNAPILILDEPTANLDPALEIQVLNSILNLSTRKSMILITHRLIGLDMVDGIIVLDKGRVVEMGSQDLLLKNNGLYQAMHRIQNQVIDPEANMPL